MLRPLLTLLLLAAPACATPNPSASLYQQQDSRSIALQNWSSQSVVSVRVQTTDGRVWNLAPAPILRNLAREVIVPARDCIANITVKLENGRTLTENGLHDCHNTQIVVRNQGVTIARQAVPGAKQHGTPG